MPGTVLLTYSPDHSVAIIQLGSDDEKAITLTPDRLTSFVAALESVRNDRPKGLVIRAPSVDSFCVGADISLIQSVTDPLKGAALAAEGQNAFNLLEDLTCITVAAIGGPCVGGGCELVLACKYRIMTDSASSQIGLPETKLGILPGFGGTYRLPKVVGLPKALDVILGGKTLRASQASKAGLVDEVVTPSSLFARAEEIARGERLPKRRPRSKLDTILSSTLPGRMLVRRQAAAGVAKQAKGFYPAPPRALEITVSGMSKSRVSALAAEAIGLGEMIVTRESKALVHLYYLTEASKALGKTFRKEVETYPIMVIGAGTMGAGIASAFARAGHSVAVKDTAEANLDRGKAHVAKELSKLRYLSSFERAAVGSRIDWLTGNSETDARAKTVIEAVFENIDLKKKILSNLAPRTTPGCILASNTSSLSVTEIAAAVPGSDRVVGMHFFNPVEKMPLVEIIRGEQTSEDTIGKVAALAVRLGKYPIVVNNVPGFLVNRVLFPYLNEALFLLQEGHSVQAIDDAATSFGMPMGPLRLLDEVGLDVAAHVSEIMNKGYGSRMSPPPIVAKLVETGRKGKKSGGGFYDHNGKESRIWPGLGSALGLPSSPREPLSRIEIVERLVFHLVNEAMKCLAEGVAGSDRDLAKKQIDLGTVMGIGFPPFRGGVIYYAEQTGLDIISKRLSSFESTLGERYRPFDTV